MPSGFKKARWDACMNNLRSEDKWDSEVVVCIRKRANGTNDPAFFELPDTLRDDVCFWRNRRNDYKQHYNLSITPRDASSDKIFKRLCLAIKTEDDLLLFFERDRLLHAI